MSSPATQTVSSQKVINNRLKNGQCIHCGIHTHKIIKKMFQKNQKIPLNLPGTVEHGRCMLTSCQQAGNTVTLDNTNKPNRLAGVVRVAGRAATVVGAVLSGLGFPGGEALRILGAAAAGTSSTNHQQTGFGNAMAAHQQQVHENIAAIQQQYLNQQQQHQDNAAAYHQQAQNNVVASLQHFQNTMAVLQEQAQKNAAASQQHLAQVLQQQQQAIQAIAKPGLAYPVGTTANIQCPNHHNCQPSAVTNI